LYLFDTDTCVALLRRNSPSLIKRLQSISPNHLAMSMVTWAELQYGVQASNRVEENRSAVALLGQHIKALDWNHEAAMHYAHARHALKTKGKLIGSNDLMIAAHALSQQALLVTNKTREFAKVPGLQLDNWVTVVCFGVLFHGNPRNRPRVSRCLD
jgi:tRNA(fMet)-specific endonuclease VapC